MKTFVHICVAAILFLSISAIAEHQNSDHCIKFDPSEVNPTSQLAPGFLRGTKRMTIRGVVNSAANNFDLQVRFNSAVLFGWAVDLKKKLIRLYDVLGKPRRRGIAPNVLFRAQEQFQLDLFKDRDHYVVFVNNSTVARLLLDNRTDFGDDARLMYQISGDVTVESVCFPDYTPLEQESFSISDAAKIGCSVIWEESPLHEIPHSNIERYVSQEGGALTVFMKPYIYNDVFTINILDAKDHCVLQLSFRQELKQTVITVGGRSKTIGQMPLYLENDQVIKIINSGNNFQIYLNETFWQSSPETYYFSAPYYVEINGSGLIYGLCVSRPI